MINFVSVGSYNYESYKQTSRICLACTCCYGAFCGGFVICQNIQKQNRGTLGKNPLR